MAEEQHSGTIRRVHFVNRRKPFAASCIAAAVQRSAIEADRHRSPLWQTRRTVLMTFSTMLVHAPIRRRSDHSDIATGCGRNVCGSAASTSVTLLELGHHS
jgi:hypothetical protein